jgi:broad specificity phosphatase PhoE
MKYNHIYRHPKTTSEKKQIEAIQTDPELKEYMISKANRLNRYIPSLYDDIMISALDENDYRGDYRIKTENLKFGQEHATHHFQ